MFRNFLEKEASEVIEQVGGIKASTKNRRELNQTQLPSEKVATIKDQVRSICRAVMRQPNKEVLEQLVFLHGKIKELFYNMSDDAINFLLIFASAEARGGFGSKVNEENDKIIETRVQKFKKFLEQDPKTIKPQILLTRIESILASMAYVYTSNTSDTPDQIEMDIKISELMMNKIISRVDYSYPSRKADIISDSSDNEDEIFSVGLEDISSASEHDEEDKYPVLPPGPRFFDKKDAPTISWPIAAQESGVPFRAHISSSTTLLMSAIESLYDSGDHPNQWFKKVENAKMLAGALLLPTLERADFHTASETAAGVIFYLNEKAKKYNKPLKPEEAFNEAIVMLGSGASKERLDKQKMSLEDAIKITRFKLTDTVDTIKSQSTILNTKKLKF